MKTSNTSEFTHVNLFLNSIDHLTERLGLNQPQIVSIEKIPTLASGTFGRSLADFLERNQLKPLTTGTRRKQLHDCIHVLTGYESDALGEAEVQAFLLGCKFNLANLLLYSLIKRRMKRKMGANSSDYNLARQRLERAYQRGQNADLNPDEWVPEQLWHVPLKTVQTNFGIYKSGHISESLWGKTVDWG